LNKEFFYCVWECEEILKFQKLEQAIIDEIINVTISLENN